MPLNKEQLEGQLAQILSDPQTENNVQIIASSIASAVDVYIKQALVVYTGGLVAPSGGGPITGVFDGNIE